MSGYQGLKQKFCYFGSIDCYEAVVKQPVTMVTKLQFWFGQNILEMLELKKIQRKLHKSYYIQSYLFFEF